ncbi:hypothetical protein B0A48_04025 [Cryoendolithus antarcticus]|uniref:DUF7918 domain-containing protein n=1 Tax=Cryoendolithus antarcticus TaxID=1507870 RepID=A0A1V8TH77_9PEZI|nr:hypothetical protein B0A48_04025 [Cryoendolithus antarcticus]
MPCFKGLAVSIHSDGQLDEFALQKQNRQSRISSYIAVPPARVPPQSTTGNPEQPNFAISITLLTPGLAVPYSTPSPTPEEPYPRPRIVGALPVRDGSRGQYTPVIAPYMPRTLNPNETVAAYIYFDGRPKEEVATLLRRGEETWVNSRWVSVPEADGGGLAEREFLFREVGLERWLNGLDLEGGRDKAAKVRRRQERLERKRKGRLNGGVKKEGNGAAMIKEEDGDVKVKMEEDHDEGMNGQEGNGDLSPSDSDDEPPEPEAAGQIKIALFRVLASGEIKRGEYSPQFDAHDDDEGSGQNGNGDTADEDVDHTTSFAKPKTLDPKSISTQTVTGIDPPDQPYAVFTFFYRGKQQLQKMGILPTPETEQTPTTSKRKSSGPDFSKLNPLNKFGTVGFSGYRDPAGGKRKGKADVASPDAMDSDNEEDDDERKPNGSEDVDVKNANGSLLSPEDARRQGEIAEGVQKIKLKRQHSAEPLSSESLTRKSPHLSTTDSPSAGGTPQSLNSTSANAGTPPSELNKTSSELLESVASPFKRHRGSVSGLGSLEFAPLGPSTNDPPPKPQHGTGKPGTFGSFGQFVQAAGIEDEDEEL